MGALIGTAVGLGSSLLSSLFAKPQVTTTDSNSTQTQNGNQNQYGVAANTHVYDEAGTNLKNYLLNLYAQSITGAAPDTTGIVNQQLSSNNTNANASQMALQHMLALHGLSGSPIAGNAYIQNEGLRAGSNANVLQQAPLLQQQMLQQRLQQAGSFFSGMPTDTMQQTHQNADFFNTGTTTSHQTQTGSTNPAGNALSTLGQGLAYMSGKGLFGK